MALLGFIKSREEEAGEPVLRDRPTILAYLEELIRLHTPVQVWFKKGDLVPTTARIDLLREEEGTILLSTQRSLPGDILPPCPMDMVFMIDGMRFRSQIRFKARDAYMKSSFQVPEVVRHAERRGKMRTRFSHRERASVTVLEGFFDGIGASGGLVNLSMEGLCMKIERALAIREDRKLPVNTSLFLAGKNLPIVRIQNLPHTPTIECAATVAHLASTPGGILMGLRLECLGEGERAILEQILTRRLPRFSRGFPVKRRWAELHIDPTEEGNAPGTEEDPEAETESPLGPEETEESLDLASIHQDHHQRLLAIRKRGKRILVVAKDEMDRAILAGTLFVDGFRMILEAGNLLEALHACRKAPPDLVIIEQQIGNADAKNFLERLRLQGDWENTPVVLLTACPCARTTLMAKSAGVAYVQAIPTDYDGELKGVLDRLLRLA